MTVEVFQNLANANFNYMYNDMKFEIAFQLITSFFTDADAPRLWQLFYA